MLFEKIKNKTAKICIIGLGYVGLPTAIHFSEQGFNVVGVDKDTEKVARISKNQLSIDDLEYEKRLKKALTEKKLEVTTDIPNSVELSDIIIIIVPTPITNTKEPDLTHVISVSEQISKKIKKGQLVILESTTFPGTTEEIVRPILEREGLKAGNDFGLAYCPERYNPGDKEHTIHQVSRIVGGITLEWANVAKELYQTIIDKDVVVVENIRTAEAAKIIENIQRDINIALFNEFAMIFQKMDIDIISVIEAASTKWNFMKLYPGPGVGGHCLPVDPYYLTHKAKEHGHHPQLILAGRSINDNMPLYVVNLIVDGLNECSKPISGSKITILGVSYKPNVSDVRESPAKKLITKLLKMGANVYVHDPFVGEDQVKKEFNVINTLLKDALKDSDCVVLHTNHSSFQDLKISELKDLMSKGALLVDTQHVFSPEDVIKAGLKYRGIGRGGMINH